MTFVLHLCVETRPVGPVVHSLLTSVWELYKVVAPGSVIHSRLRVPEIVAFWILDFVDILVTWRLDYLQESKFSS